MRPDQILKQAQTLNARLEKTGAVRSPGDAAAKRDDLTDRMLAMSRRFGDISSGSEGEFMDDPGKWRGSTGKKWDTFYKKYEQALDNVETVMKTSPGY